MFNPESPPDITASRWLNSERARSLKAEKGKVVVVAIAQILCPGSQKYGLPQAMRLRGAFSEREVTVFGLHMTFEQFAAQTPDKVQAYLTEHEITIPVAYDQPNGEDEPQTMVDYSLQGTPAILVFDRQGRLRRHYLGAVDDLRLGAEVMALLIEDETSPREMSIALERKMAMALVDPDAHEHEGGCCGGHHHDHNHGHGHDHDHDHDHHHHAHGEGGCCGGGGCGGEGKCKNEHGHAHGHDDEHDHHAHGSGQCGCGAKDDAKV